MSFGVIAQDAGVSTAHAAGQPKGESASLIAVASADPPAKRSADWSNGLAPGPDNSEPPAPARDPSASSSRRAVFTALAVECSLGLIAIALGWIFTVPATADLQWQLRAFLLGAAATLPMLFLFVVFLRVETPAIAELRGLLDQFVVNVFGSAGPLELAAVAAAAGIGEELLFRGFLQAAFEPGLGAWGALVAASLLFGLAHAVSFAYFAMATVFGAWLGWIWVLSGNLFVPITAHALYDLVALWFFLFVRNGADTGVRDRIAN